MEGLIEAFRQAPSSVFVEPGGWEAPGSFPLTSGTLISANAQLSYLGEIGKTVKELKRFQPGEQ